MASLAARVVAADDRAAGGRATASRCEAARVLLRRLALDKGQVSLFDQSQPGLERANFDDISLDVQDLATMAGHEGDYADRRQACPAAEEWNGAGSSRSSPIASEGEIAVKGAQAFAPACRFLPIDAEHRRSPRHDRPGPALQGDAYGGGNASVSADNLSLAVNGLELKLKGTEAPILQLEEAKLQGGTFDLEQRRIAFTELALRRDAWRPPWTSPEPPIGSASWRPPLRRSEPAPAASVPARRNPGECRWRRRRSRTWRCAWSTNPRVQPLAVEIRAHQHRLLRRGADGQEARGVGRPVVGGLVEDLRWARGDAAEPRRSCSSEVKVERRARGPGQARRDDRLRCN